MRIREQDSPDHHSKSAHEAIHTGGFCMCHQKLACVLIVCAVRGHGPSSGSLKPQAPSMIGKEATQHHIPLLPLPKLSCYLTMHDLAMSALLQES